MLKNESKLRFIVTLVLLCTVLGCSAIQFSRAPTALEPVPVQPFDGTIILLNEGEDVRERILSDPASALAWGQKQNAFPTGGRWGTWLGQFTLSNDEHAARPSGLYRLSSQQPAYGRLLISHVYNTPHSLALIFLLNYQPLQIQTESGLQAAYYLPEMPAGAELAVEFLFPPLPQGLHHLSMILITDPESESTDPEYRRNQQWSFSEQRIDLWVDIEAIPADTPAFASLEQARSATFKLLFDLVELDPSPHKRSEELQLIEALQLEASAQNEVGLRFVAEAYSSNLPPYTGTLPLRIGVFWNEALYTAFDYELDPKLKLAEPLLLPFTIETPSEPGQYQMHVIAFPIPWHPHFDADGEWIAFNLASFSRRIPVSVIEKR